MTNEARPEIPSTMRQIRTLVSAQGQLELSIVEVDMPVPGPGEVLVRIEATPINPSDLGLLLAAADITRASSAGTPESPVVTAPITAAVMRGLGARVGESMAVGNEGAGVVVAAGDSPDARALVGQMVGMAGGQMYAEYRVVPALMCMVMPEGTAAEAAASCFVNPLTALGMVTTMRMENHTGLVHTAAASNLGQMLNRVCNADGVPLVNIVRRPEQATILRDQGALHVCDSSSPTFLEDLTTALVSTGATLAFDAIGGGTLAGQILGCMESAANSTAAAYSRYGSTTHKQVYIYGGLDRSPTELNRNFGMAWGVGGWLLTPFLAKLGVDGMLGLRARVIDEILTTFASTYTDEVSLAGALGLDAITAYARQATGQKFLIRPSL